jgi:hypothetical protein
LTHSVNKLTILSVVEELRSIIAFCWLSFVSTRMAPSLASSNRLLIAFEKHGCGQSLQMLPP